MSCTIDSLPYETKQKANKPKKRGGSFSKICCNICWSYCTMMLHWSLMLRMGCCCCFSAIVVIYCGYCWRCFCLSVDDLDPFGSFSMQCSLWLYFAALERRSRNLNMGKHGEGGRNH